MSSTPRKIDDDDQAWVVAFHFFLSFFFFVLGLSHSIEQFDDTHYPTHAHFAHFFFLSFLFFIVLYLATTNGAIIYYGTFRVQNKQHWHIEHSIDSGTLHRAISSPVMFRSVMNNRFLFPYHWICCGPKCRIITLSNIHSCFAISKLIGIFSFGRPEWYDLVWL